MTIAIHIAKNKILQDLRSTDGDFGYRSQKVSAPITLPNEKGILIDAYEICDAVAVQVRKNTGTLWPRTFGRGGAVWQKVVDSAGAAGRRNAIARTGYKNIVIAIIEHITRRQNPLRCIQEQLGRWEVAIMSSQDDPRITETTAIQNVRDTVSVNVTRREKEGLIRRDNLASEVALAITPQKENYVGTLQCQASSYIRIAVVVEISSNKGRSNQETVGAKNGTPQR